MKSLLPTVPPEVWRRSPRPSAGLTVRLFAASFVGLLGLFAGDPILQWAFLGLALAVFFVSPRIADTRLPALEAEVRRSEGDGANRLLKDLPERRIVRWFAPATWLAVQKAELHLRRGDARAAAMALAEARQQNALGRSRPELGSAEVEAHLRANDRKPALALLEQMKEVAKLRAFDQMNFGVVVLSEGGRHDEAREALEAARDGLGDLPRLWAGLASARARTGDGAGAREALERAESLVSEDPDLTADDLIRRAKKDLRGLETKEPRRGKNKKKRKKGSRSDRKKERERAQAEAPASEEKSESAQADDKVAEDTTKDAASRKGPRRGSKKARKAARREERKKQQAAEREARRLEEQRRKAEEEQARARELEEAVEADRRRREAEAEADAAAPTPSPATPSAAPPKTAAAAKAPLFAPPPSKAMTPAPVATPTPAPVAAKPTPAPVAAKPTPTPVAKPTPVATKPTPAPVAKPTPAPAAKPTPAPAAPPAPSLDDLFAPSGPSAPAGGAPAAPSIPAPPKLGAPPVVPPPPVAASKPGSASVPDAWADLFDTPPTPSKPADKPKP